MHIGLFFGSFNPIHHGHLIIAQTILNESNLDELWLVLSPQNPFKENSSLLKESLRYKMVQLAIKDNPAIKCSDIEFSMSKPSYTINTLNKLSLEHPNNEFSLIMGSDNLINFHKWKSYESVLELINTIIIYPRPGFVNKNEIINQSNYRIINAPKLEISSTEIRNRITKHKSIRYLVPIKVRQFIEENQLYNYKQEE